LGQRGLKAGKIELNSVLDEVALRGTDGFVSGLHSRPFVYNYRGRPGRRRGPGPARLLVRSGR